MLYPIKFKPILKDVIWGGTRLRDAMGKNTDSDSCGESWEISAVKENISVVANGFLKGNSLQEIIEVYMGDLVGDHIYETFGLQFPLLIKFIDANDLLSIQVHPDNELAFERHNSLGKNEMWYIIDAGKDAELITGFRESISKEIYLKHFAGKTLPEILNYEEAKAGDVFFMPAGRVHAIGAGILLAEIQQTSDITYRIYDWDRLDKDGKGRELHTELAVDAIDYNDTERYRMEYSLRKNEIATVVDTDFFTTRIMQFDQPVEKDFTLNDSFVIFMCVEGGAEIHYGGEDNVPVKMGETVLIPASLNNLEILPGGTSRLLEIYIK